MKAGTIPLNNQEPANDPTRKSIKIDGRDELILFTIPFWISSQVKPKLNAIIEAIAEDNINTICILPDNESSPNIETLIDNNITRNIIGIKAWRVEGDFILLISD